jgi:hypothetical protein
VRTSDFSERAFASTIEGNDKAESELRRAYRLLQYTPRALGVRFREDEPGPEHWVFESPKIPRRPRLRIYYLIHPTERVVSIERIQLL